MFLDASASGFRGQDDPSVHLAALERKWVPEATVLYIGTATASRSD